MSHQSKIPSFSISQDHKRQRLSQPITSNIHSYSRIATGTNKQSLSSKDNITLPLSNILKENTEIMNRTSLVPSHQGQKNFNVFTTTSENKYMFGSVSEIEQIKDKARPFFKNTSRARKELANLQRQLEEKERHLQDLKYNNNKFVIANKKLNTDLENIKIKNSQLNENFELIQMNNQIKIDTLKQSKENELNTFKQNLENEKIQERLSWEKKINDLKKLPLDEELLKEIDTLKDTIIIKESEQKKLDIENDLITKEYEEKLRIEFETFKSKKLISLDNLINESNSLSLQLEELKKNKDILINENNELDKINSELKNENDKLNNQIQEIELETIPLQSQLENLLIEYNKQLEKTNEAFEKAEYEKSLYNKAQIKLQEERIRNKKLQYSIEDWKGTIRVYSYLNPSKFFKKNIQYSFNSNDMTIINRENINSPYHFTNIISKEEFPDETSMLINNYQIYHNTTLEKDIPSFSYFSLNFSDKTWNTLYSSLMKTLLDEKYLKKFNLSIQNVLIDDDGSLIDLNDNSTNENIDTLQTKYTFFIDEKSVDLESSTIRITEENRNENIINRIIDCDDKSLESRSGIRLTKIIYERKELPEKQAAFYFVQLDYKSSLEKISRIMNTKNKEVNGPVLTLLRTLSLNIKSCFILNMLEETDKFKDILQLSKDIYKTKATR